MEQQKSTGSVQARISMTSEKEVELLKSVFKGNEELLRATRLIMFGLPVSDVERKLVKDTFVDSNLKRAFRRKIYPIFEEDMPDVPVNSLADFWYGTEMNVNGRDKDTITQNIDSKMRAQEMFSTGIKVLTGENTETINLKYEPFSFDPLGVYLIARNLYIKSVNEGINIIKLIVDQEKETPTAAKNRLAKNSSK